MMELKGLADSIQTGNYFKKGSNEYERDLDEGFELMSQYILGERPDSEWIDLEWTASIQNRPDKLDAVQQKLMTSLRALFSNMKTDTSYVFEYIVVDDKGRELRKFVHLTPQNTKIVADLLQNRPRLINS